MLKNAVRTPIGQTRRSRPDTISYRVEFDSSSNRVSRDIHVLAGFLPEEHLDTLGIDRGTYVVIPLGVNI